MPIARYQIRNEYTLADPELYRAADKDDPEALLEGVAMAGLVGLLRQLGDLSEFAAEIFHDLHEEVTATAARGHGLRARVQQLEAEVPSLEKAFLSQTHHLSFFSNGGIDWHPNLRSEQNLISRGDLPRFIMDSYEECRGPPRLFLLDKFDVAGAGACLKRYTDPSFFKMESASSVSATVKVQRERGIRKPKKKAARLRNGETPEFVPTHTKLHQLLLEERIENACSDPARLVKLKKRQLNGSTDEAKTGKSYMEKFLETPSCDHKVVCKTSISPHPVRLMSDDISETGIKILEISTVSPVKRSFGNESKYLGPNEQEPELKPSSEMHRETNGDLVKVHKQLSAGVTDEMSLNHCKVPDETELAVDEQKKIRSGLDGYYFDDVTSEVDHYLDGLATVESEMEIDNECRPKYNLLNILKLRDSDDKEYQLQARLSDSHSFGGSSTSDEISSFKRDRNEEHAELQARLSDSQSFGASSTSDENSSFKRDRNEEYIELQTRFSDAEFIGNSSASDVHSSFKKDRSCFSHSDSLSTVVETVQSEPTLLPSTKYYESEIEDAPSNQLSQIVEPQIRDCGEFLMHDDTQDHDEIADLGQVSSASYLMNSGHILLHSNLGATSPITLPAGNQSGETPSDPVELHLRLADEDTKCHVESIDAGPDALSLMKVNACPAFSSEKYPLNKFDDGDQYVNYDALLQISNYSEKDSEDEYCDCSEIKVLPAESPNENSTSREIGSQGEHHIGSSIKEVYLYSGTKVRLDGLVSKAVDSSIANQHNSEDLSPAVKTLPVSSFTREQCSDLIYNCPQDELDSAVVDVKCFDQQSNFGEISRMAHGGEVSGYTCSVDADENDGHLKDSSSADYMGQENQVMVYDVVTAKVLSEDQAVFAVSSADHHEKEMETNKPAATESLTELVARKVVDQPDIAFADVRLSIKRSVPCDPSNLEICNNIQDSSLKVQTRYSSSVNDMKMVSKFSELDTQGSESISLWQNELLLNDKDGLSSPSYNQPKAGIHSEQFLQSQVGQQDAGFLLRDVENSSSGKLQSEQMQISNHLEEERSSHAAPEIHLDQPSSSELLSLSASQEINPTRHVMDEPLPLLPDLFPKASEISFEEMPPMPPLPPRQWRTGKVQHASLASQREAIEVSQTSFHPMQSIKSNGTAQYGLPTSERGTLQYQNPFLPVMAVEGGTIQHTSGFSVGRHHVSVPMQLPIMIDEASNQYNYLVLERSQIQNPYLTLPLPMVSTSTPSHSYIAASEGETLQYSNPSLPMAPVERANSGHDPISPQELSQPLSQLMTEPSLEVKTLQQSMSNLEGEQGDPSNSLVSPPSMENVQANHNRLPSEGEMASSLDTPALASDSELEKPNGKPKNKLPRPRSPLIDAVAAHDKSMLRKVAERVRPQIAPKVDERDSLLEQIRTKSFNLKPAALKRPSYQGPRTNLKVAAILEKANAIRQALAGSDEDDDVDSWSDS